MAKKRKAFLLRLPPDVHDALRRWADDEMRSLNAQLEYVLTRALRDRHRIRDDASGGNSSTSSTSRRDDDGDDDRGGTRAT